MATISGYPARASVSPTDRLFIAAAQSANPASDQIASATVAQILAAAGAATATTGLALPPQMLSFGPQLTGTYYDPQPAGMVVLHNEFVSAGAFTQASVGSSTSAFTTASGVGTVTISGASNAVLGLYDPTFSPAVPHLFISVDIASFTSNGAGGFANLNVGLYKDASNSLVASYGALGNTLQIQQLVSGSYFPYTTVTRAVSAPFKLGFSLVGNSASLWINSGAGWDFVVNSAVSNFDYTAPGAMAGYRAGFMAGCGSGGLSWQVSNLQAGAFGGVGLRDTIVVTNADGTPHYASDGSPLITATAVDPAGSGACNVYKLNPTTFALTQVASLYMATAGAFVPGLNGSIIYYPTGERKVFLTDWGSSATSRSVYYQDVSAGAGYDVLSGANVLSGMSKLSLPLGGNGATGCYDECVAYDTVNARWLCAYTLETANAANFWPALASSPDLSTWTLIGEDFTATKYEGTKLLNVGGLFYVLTNGPNGGPAAPRVYNAGMTYSGTLSGAVFTTGSGTPIGHPCCFAYEDSIVLFSFNNTQFNSGGVFTTGQPTFQRSPAFW